MKNFAIFFVQNEEKKQYEVTLKNDLGIEAKEGEYPREIINLISEFSQKLYDFCDAEKTLRLILVA